MNCHVKNEGNLQKTEKGKMLNFKQDLFPIFFGSPSFLACGLQTFIQETFCPQSLVVFLEQNQTSTQKFQHRPGSPLHPNNTINFVNKYSPYTVTCMGRISDSKVYREQFNNTFNVYYIFSFNISCKERKWLICAILGEYM